MKALKKGMDVIRLLRKRGIKRSSGEACLEGTPFL